MGSCHEEVDGNGTTKSDNFSKAMVVRDEPRGDGAREGLRPGQQIPKIFVKRAMAM